MRILGTMAGQALATTASFVLLTACGGGGSGDGGILDNTTTSTTANTTSTTRASTTTTVTTTTTTTVAGVLVNNGVQYMAAISFLCLNDAVANGANQVQCFNNVPSQSWKVTRFGTNFTLTNNQTNKCLSIAGGSKADLALAVTATCDGSPQTLWTITPTGADQTRVNIINVNSGKCLEIPPPGGANAQADQFTCGNAQPNQTWVRTILTP